MKFFRPRIEQLELRQLMASDTDVALPNSSDSNSSFSYLSSANSGQTGSASSDSVEFIVGNPAIDYATDSVVARVDLKVIIASRLNSTLLIINNSVSDSPKIDFRISLGDLSIQDMKVDGTRAIVFGQSSYDHTQVISIDLMAGKIVNRVQFAPGIFRFGHLAGSNAWVVLSQSTKPIISPTGAYIYQDDSRLIHLRWGESGLVEQSSLHVDNGQWAVANNRLLMASDATQGESLHNITLHVYDIGKSQLSESASLFLQSSYAKSIAISADGQRASLIRGVGDGNANWKSSVDFFDLSDTSIRIAQSTAFDDFLEVYQHDSDQALVYGQVKRKLATIDLRSVNASQSRTHSWEVPQWYDTSLNPIQLSDGRIGVSSYVFDQGPNVASTSTSIPKPEDGSYLLILDPKTSQLSTVRAESMNGRFLSLEPGTNRIGVWGWGGDLSKFTYGNLDENLQFVEQGTIDGMDGIDARRDQPFVFSNRLVTAFSDQVSVYDLQQSGKTLLVENVSGKPVPLVAKDLEIRVSKWGTGLNPYPTFEATVPNVDRIRLVALEGAPDDVRISDPITIRFAPYDDVDRQPTDFVYVISDGITQARGRIHVVYSEYDINFLQSIGGDSNSASNQSNSGLGNNGSTPILKHNAQSPMDVNGDATISAIDVLIVINAINDTAFKSSEHSIDTNGNGLLEPIDSLIVINFLNRLSEMKTPNVTNASEVTINEIRTDALKEHLARGLRQDPILVGFQKPDSPTNRNAALSYAEYMNQIIQSLEPPTTAFLSQAGLERFDLGSSSQAIWQEFGILNSNTREDVSILRIGIPRNDEDGLVHLEIVDNFGTMDGASGFDYQLEFVEGRWKVVAGRMNWIS